tara:strand:- start:1521 stop:2462 length:942 start_codon:yes stop_codon:yes gene_type:complete
MSVALIFPGQGSQNVGMGKDLYANYSSAKAVFQEVDDSLSQNLSSIIFNGSEEELTLTENAQPAIMAVSIALMNILVKDFSFNIKSKVLMCAGHSLGEYTALAATACLNIGETARLLKARGLSMQKAVAKGKGAMAALIGPNIEQVEEILKNLPDNLVCEIANHNTESQTVISGDTSAVDNVIQFCQSNKIRAVKLVVSAPFHCSLMNKTAEELKLLFEEIVFNPPITSVVSNYTAKTPANIEDLKNNLIKQTYSTVKWYDSINFMIKSGVKNFCEIGNGKVLTGIIKRINKNVGVYNIESYRDIENVLEVIE